MRCIDLFSGAGGFSAGAALAGLTPVWAANHWPAAAVTGAAAELQRLSAERDELAARLAEIEAQEPVAWVPIHPRTGPLWSMTTGSPDEERLPHYPLKPLYTRPAPAAAPERASGRRVEVDAGALQMVINALRRDAEDGRTVRGEMADALTATMSAAPERADHCEDARGMVQPPAAETARQPLTDEQIHDIVREASTGAATRRDGTTSTRIARAIERAHRIGAEGGAA